MTPQRIHELTKCYQKGLLDDVIPFWLRHGLDQENGGILTSLNEDGAIIDTDKSVWFQGRAAWTFATLYNTVERCPEWLNAAESALAFLRDHCRGPRGKLYFTVTREGRPLRMRRYFFSEVFAAIGSAAFAKAANLERPRDEAMEYFAAFLAHSFGTAGMSPKSDPDTRPAKDLSTRMITIGTAQEIRANLGDLSIGGATCTQWIERMIEEIERDFYKPEARALMEMVGPTGDIIDHFDGRTLNPGHGIECAWFILHEARLRRAPKMVELGCSILDCMWERGWDSQYGGLLYYTDLKNLPVQEYWAEMKFWWPHNEAIIATLLAWHLTGAEKYAAWHASVHNWAHRHFPDSRNGEWFGYLRRDGTVATRLKGNTWKGPFHLPRMQWYCWQLLRARPS